MVVRNIVFTRSRSEGRDEAVLKPASFKENTWVHNAMVPKKRKKKNEHYFEK